jgi:UDP-glucose 4-epimerase
MPNILIHGASSFLGKHFALLLSRHNIPFTVIARKNSNLSFLNLSQNISVFRYTNSILELSEASLDQCVFYEFSWNGVFGNHRNDIKQYTINIPLILDSINFAYNFGAVHWVGIGSQAEYGNLNKKISEEDECFPTTLYGKAKLHCSKISMELCQALGIHHTWLRLFSVYGPYDNHEWLIQYLIKKMLNHEVIDVTNGDQFWDYLYVEDIANLLLKISSIKGCGILNLGSGNSEQVKKIILLIRELTSSTSKINFGAIPYRTDQVMHMEADISQLIRLTGWSPTTSLREGLIKTIEFMKLQEVK